MPGHRNINFNKLIIVFDTSYTGIYGTVVNHFQVHYNYTSHKNNCHAK